MYPHTHTQSQSHSQASRRDVKFCIWRRLKVFILINGHTESCLHSFILTIITVVWTKRCLTSIFPSCTFYVAGISIRQKFNSFGNRREIPKQQQQQWRDRLKSTLNVQWIANSFRSATEKECLASKCTNHQWITMILSRM